VYGQEVPLIFQNVRALPQNDTSHPWEATSRVEEYISEFKQLQMRVLLNEGSKLTIARFIKGQSPKIANKMTYNLIFRLMMFAI